MKVKLTDKIRKFFGQDARADAASSESITGLEHLPSELGKHAFNPADVSTSVLQDIPPGCAVPGSGMLQEKVHLPSTISQKADLSSNPRTTGQDESYSLQNEVYFPQLLLTLQSGTPEQKAVAAEALFNYTAESESARQRATQAGVVQHLIGLLQQGTDHGKMYAAYTLSSLTSVEDSLQQMRSLGAITALIAILQQCPLLVCKKGAMRALGRLARNDDAASDIVAANGLGPIIALLSRSDSSLVRRCLIALYFIGADKDALQQAIGAAGALPHLLSLASSDSPDVQAEATDVLKVLCRNAACGQALAELGGFEVLVGLVQGGLTSRAKASAARALQRLNDIPELREQLACSPAKEVLEAGAAANNSQLSTGNAVNGIEAAMIPPATVPAAVAIKAASTAGSSAQHKAADSENPGSSHPAGAASAAKGASSIPVAAQSGANVAVCEPSKLTTQQPSASTAGADDVQNAEQLCNMLKAGTDSLVREKAAANVQQVAGSSQAACRELLQLGVLPSLLAMLHASNSSTTRSSAAQALGAVAADTTALRAIAETESIQQVLDAAPQLSGSAQAALMKLLYTMTRQGQFLAALPQQQTAICMMKLLERVPSQCALKTSDAAAATSGTATIAAGMAPVTAGYGGAADSTDSSTAALALEGLLLLCKADVRALNHIKAYPGGLRLLVNKLHHGPRQLVPSILQLLACFTNCRQHQEDLLKGGVVPVLLGFYRSDNADVATQATKIMEMLSEPAAHILERTLSGNSLKVQQQKGTGGTTAAAAGGAVAAISAAVAANANAWHGAEPSAQDGSKAVESDSQDSAVPSSSTPAQQYDAHARSNTSSNSQPNPSSSGSYGAPVVPNAQQVPASSSIQQSSQQQSEEASMRIAGGSDGHLRQTDVQASSRIPSRSPTPTRSPPMVAAASGASPVTSARSGSPLFRLQQQQQQHRAAAESSVAPTQAAKRPVTQGSSSGSSGHHTSLQEAQSAVSSFSAAASAGGAVPQLGPAALAPASINGGSSSSNRCIDLNRVPSASPAAAGAPSPQGASPSSAVKERPSAVGADTVAPRAASSSSNRNMVKPASPGTAPARAGTTAAAVPASHKQRQVPGLKSPQGSATLGALSVRPPYVVNQAPTASPVKQLQEHQQHQQQEVQQPQQQQEQARPSIVEQQAAVRPSVQQMVAAVQGPSGAGATAGPLLPSARQPQARLQQQHQQQQQPQQHQQEQQHQQRHQVVECIAQQPQQQQRASPGQPAAAAGASEPADDGSSVAASAAAAASKQQHQTDAGSIAAAAERAGLTPRDPVAVAAAVLAEAREDSPVAAAAGKAGGSSAAGSSNAAVAADADDLLSSTYDNLHGLLMKKSDIAICRTAEGRKCRLGEGGFGVVYKAVMNGVDEVAVKLVKAESPTRKEMELFLKEVQTLAKLHHRNIVQFYGACLETGSMFFVTELMKGGDLYTALRHHSETMRWERLGRKVALDVALGLNYLHAQRPPMMHRDLKSPNVLLSEEGVAKIADVGMVRSQVKDLVTAQPVMTPLWAAPEVVRHERASIKADIWSYGILIWELISGEDITEFQPLSISRQVAPSPTAKAMALPVKCPTVARKIFTACTQMDPERRPAAQTLVEWLRADMSANRF